jgi:hypothetical protein
MTIGRRKSVDVLTAENWRDSARTRLSCGIRMGARIEDAGDGRYVGIYGFPQKGFGSEVIFDSLDEALTWANRDGGGVMIFIEDRPLR